MGIATVSKIVEETIAAIWNILRPVYLPNPTIEQLKDVEKRFYSKCNFPNVMYSTFRKYRKTLS